MCTNAFRFIVRCHLYMCNFDVCVFGSMYAMCNFDVYVFGWMYKCIISMCINAVRCTRMRYDVCICNFELYGCGSIYIYICNFNAYLYGSMSIC